MFSVFKCHPDCPQVFQAQIGLTQHHKTCGIYTMAEAERTYFQASVTFRLTEEPPLKQVRQGTDESQVLVADSLLVIPLNSIPGRRFPECIGSSNSLFNRFGQRGE